MNWSLGNYWYLFLLLLVPLLAVVLVNYRKWKKNRRNTFAETRFQDELFEDKSRFYGVFPLLYFIAFVFLIFSIIDLLGGKEEIKSSQKMNNVIFVLDVSNSMNAEDVEPNRLTLAKNLIINTMQKMTNDRVGIVVFAGEASSIMPLTTDYSAAETYISGIETNIMKIQGTDFLKAMEETARKFKNIAKGSRKVVLISDGEDNEGNEDRAIRLAKNEGMSVISVGVGSDEGAPVPVYVFGQLMGYKTDRSGQTILSQRQTVALEKTARSTGGTYIDGNNLEQAIQQIHDALNNKNSTTESLVQSHNSIHYYQYFLAVSLLFFLLIYFLNPKRDLNV